MKLKDQTNCQYAKNLKINIQYFVIRRKNIVDSLITRKGTLNNASMARRYGINNLPSRVIKGTI